MTPALIPSLTIDEAMGTTPIEHGGTIRRPFSEFHSRVVDHPIEHVWPHCLDVTAQEIRTIGPLFALRGLPTRLRGRRPPEASRALPLLEVFASEGFIVLRRDDAPIDGRASVIFGAAGRFWSVTGNAPIPFDSPNDFLAFEQPDHAKTVARLDAIDLGNGTTRIETETLVRGTDAASTKAFGRYWGIIRLPSGLIRLSWLAAIDRRANR